MGNCQHQRIKRKEVIKLVDEWLGKKIKAYMEENRFTQAYLSKNTGIPPDKVSASLNGKRRFTFSEYERICGALKVNTNKFLKPRKPSKKGE